MQCTADQIAREIGVSNSTVSRVLNNSCGVSESLRNAVLEAIREKGVVPRLKKRRGTREHSPMRRRSTGLVEILMVRRSLEIETVEAPVEVGPETSPHSLPVERFFTSQARYANAYYRHVIDGAIDELRRHGLRATLQVSSDLAAPHLLKEINDPQNRGLLMLGDFLPQTEAFLQKCKCPTVSFISWNHPSWLDYVGIDNLAGIRMAFEHLRSLGHTRIGYVAGERRGVFQERLAAYKMMMAEAGLPYRADWVVECRTLLSHMQPAVEQILQQPDRPTAFACCFDGAALAVRHAASRLGLRIPQDLSVVGFDDEEIAQAFSPPLTTIRVPTLHMGRQAVQLLRMRMENGGIRPGDGWSLRAMPALVVRESTAPPANGNP